MFNRSRVTFVEELPDIDETSIIENYEHSNPKQPSGGPPPPLPSKSGNSPYSYYGSVYGGNEQPKKPPSGPPMPTTMGNFKDESREKDLLLERAEQRRPSQGRIIAASPGRSDDDEDERYRYPRDPPDHHAHAHPYIIYEENPMSLPKYTVSRPRPQRPVQPRQPPPPAYPMYPPPLPPTNYPHQPIYPGGPPPPNMMHPPPDQVQTSVCNMINKHLSTCALCSKLYTSNIKHQQKLGAAACGTGRNMSVVIYVIIILLLIITCIVLFRKLYNKSV